MSFGKKSSTPVGHAKVSPGAPSLTVKGFAVVALVVSGIGASYAAYNHRQLIAYYVYPPALTTMKLADRQLENLWKTAPRDLGKDTRTIVWSMLQMAKLCEDHDQSKIFEDQLAFEDKYTRGAFAEFDPSEYRNLYRSAEQTAGAMVANLATQRDTFCSSKYAVAIHDGRYMTSNFLQRHIDINDAKIRKSLEISRRLEKLRDVAISVARKEAANGGVAVDHSLTDDEKNYVLCNRANGYITEEVEKIASIYDCFWESNDSEQILADHNQAERRGITGQATTPQRQQESSTAVSSYSSPDVDIRESCRRVHKDNYEYRDICERNQEEAKAEIAGMNVPDEIASYCDRVHDSSYEYRKICYENQIKAKERLGY